MKDNKQTIVSMIVGENKLTLITFTGNVIEMRDDSTYDTAKLIKDVQPKLSGSNVVDINLNDYLSVVKALSEPAYETNGITISHTVNGVEVQGIFYPEKVSVQVQLSTEEEPITIPNIENLEKHITRAAKEDSPAVRNFLKRLAPVAKDRLHSAEDLMMFINKSEMPLTHDGKIIGYKRVRQGKKDHFVDCHSGNISQRVGSRVMMDIDGVDADRNRSCSHGLHVANLGYLSGFSGSHTLIVLVDPADFIAVPHHEYTKCRVCAYDIIGVMTGSAHKIVGREAVEDVTLDSLIKDAIEGNYQRPDEVVKVGVREVLERHPITEEELNDPFNAEAAQTSVDSSPSSLNKDTKVTKESAKKVIDEVRGSLAQKWTKGPENLLKAFTALHAGELSKAQIARDAETSTRTLARWQEKYDYDGFVVDLEQKATDKAEQDEIDAEDAVQCCDCEDPIPNWLQRCEDCQERFDEDEKKRYDVVITDNGGSKIDVIKIVRIELNLPLKEALAMVDNGCILENVEEHTANNLVGKLRKLSTNCKVSKILTGTPWSKVEPVKDNPGVPTPEPKKSDKPKSIKEQARDLFDKESFVDLAAFKKAKKKSWDSLGFDQMETQTIFNALHE